MENNKQVQQDKENLSIYDRVRTVPKEAMTSIDGGRLKGNSSITPMWRIKKLTEVFGPVGFGWYTEVIRTWTEASESGEMAVFVDINLFVKKDGEWSRPIFGNGGNKLIANEKKYDNGQTVYVPYLDDDAYKMSISRMTRISIPPKRGPPANRLSRLLLNRSCLLRAETGNRRLRSRHPSRTARK